MFVGPDTAVLFLHALPLDGRMWAAQRDFLRGPTYAPDLYGFGDDIQNWAHHALDMVVEERVVVVGNSVGGSCALEVRRLAPSRVAGLVLVGTKADRRADPAMLKETTSFVSSYGVAAAWERYWAPLFTGPQSQATAQAAKAIALEQSCDHLINGLRAFYTRPSRGELVAKGDLPVCVVSGDQDSLPGPAYAKMLAQRAKRGQSVIFPDCGHFVPMAQAAQFNAVLAAFLQNLDPVSARRK